MNESDKTVAKFQGKVPAVKQYKDRTKCGLIFAKQMIEKFCDDIKVYGT